MKIKKILFICKHNRFRSKVAETFFNKLNKNKKIRAFSRGIGLDKDGRQVAPNVQRALRVLGIKKVDTRPRKFTSADFKKADLIVNVANDVKLPKNLIAGKRVLNWKVSDTSQEDYPGILKREKIIRKKVKGLIKDIGHTKL